MSTEKGSLGESEQWILSVSKVNIMVGAMKPHRDTREVSEESDLRGVVR